MSVERLERDPAKLLVFYLIPIVGGTVWLHSEVSDLGAHEALGIEFMDVLMSPFDIYVGIPLVPLVLAYGVKPNRVTAIASLVGMAAWLLCCYYVGGL